MQMLRSNNNELAGEIFIKMIYAPAKNSYHPKRPCCPIRVFTLCIKKSGALTVPLRRPWNGF